MLPLLVIQPELGTGVNKDTHKNLGRINSARIGLQRSFVVTQARVVVVVVNEVGAPETMGVLNLVYSKKSIGSWLTSFSIR